MLDLEAPAETLRRVADGISDEVLTAPTPCQVDVATILAHVLGLSVAFREAAYKVSSPMTTTPPKLSELRLVADWRQELPVVLDELVRAWRDPEAWEGMTEAGSITMPAPVAAAVANDELVLHGWDLAVATGQAYAPEPANLAAAWEMVSNTPDDPAARDGLFGPVVPVPEDAPLLHRVLGASGRDPHWEPPA